MSNEQLQEEEEGQYEVYITRECLEAVYRHANSNLPHEVIGFLLGRPFRWNGKIYTLIYDYIEGRAKASEIHVEFEDDALGEVVLRLRERGDESVIVGWYHSHPGYGCFLSPTDIKSHIESFKEDFHVALVVDPVNRRAGFFKVGGDGGVKRPSVAVIALRNGEGE